MTDTFTPKQLADWKLYESVRSEGHYNMFDLRARQATGLSVVDYQFVMRNFPALREAVLREAVKGPEVK